MPVTGLALLLLLKIGKRTVQISPQLSDPMNTVNWKYVLFALAPHLFFWETPIVQAQTSQSIYVSTTGNDANPGTLDLPLSTLSKAVTFANGQNPTTIYLFGGQYMLCPDPATPLAPAVQILPPNTSEVAPITITNHNNELVTLTGAWEFKGSDVGQWSQVVIQAFDGDHSTGVKSVTVWKLTFDKNGAIGADLTTRLANLRAAQVNGGHGSVTQVICSAESFNSV